MCDLRFWMARAQHCTIGQNDWRCRNCSLDFRNSDVHVRGLNEQFHIPQTQSLSGKQNCFLHGLAVNERPICRIMIVQKNTVGCKRYIAMMRRDAGMIDRKMIFGITTKLVDAEIKLQNLGLPIFILDD